MTGTDLFTLPTASADDTLNVSNRLELLANWEKEYQQKDAQLVERLKVLDLKNSMDKQRGKQIATYRCVLQRTRVKQPFELTTEVLAKFGNKPDELWQHLAQQYVRLSKVERLLWLNYLFFIITPDIRELNEKIKNIVSYISLGHQRNFLLGGLSGMGKTTYLDWLTFRGLLAPGIEHNQIDIIKIDATVSNHTAKPLLQRLILACGTTYLKSDNEEELLNIIALVFQQCGVKLIIIDEIEHITRPELRRRILELSNLLPQIPIICASPDPAKWVEGDNEVARRWNDKFYLNQYTGTRLKSLLAYIELLLPFTTRSNLAPISPVSSKQENGNDQLAKLIQSLTGGILTEIMILIWEASKGAIEAGEPCLTQKRLEGTWRNIQHKPVSDFSQFAQDQTI